MHDYYFGHHRIIRDSLNNRTLNLKTPAVVVVGIFHSHKILPIALWPWDRLSL